MVTNNPTISTQLQQRSLLPAATPLALEQSIDVQGKRFRPPPKSAISTSKFIPKPIPEELGNLKTYSMCFLNTFHQYYNVVLFLGNPDILICGNCRDLFEDLVDLIEHKKKVCKTRFICKCDCIKNFKEAFNIERPSKSFAWELNNQD